MTDGKENPNVWLCKGSYTVEAAWVVSISLTLIMVCVLTGFTVFENALQYVSQAGESADMSAVTLFRQKTMADDLWSLWTGD